jgi:transcriptional regulator with XRE-family HTH domain
MTEQQIVASQFRGARAMTGLKVAELARKAHVAPNTVVRIEGGRNVSPRSLAAVQGALEASGIEFVDRGIRMRSDGERDKEREVERKVARILQLADQIRSLPTMTEGSPEELIGYDEFGAPN